MAVAFYQPGIVQDYVNPGPDVLAAGSIVDLGSDVGVADNDIAANQLGGLRRAGVYNIPNPDDTAFAVGATVNWDGTKAVSAGGFAIGTAYVAYVAGSLYVQVAINDRLG